MKKGVEIKIGNEGWMMVFFFSDTATTEIYTLSLHDALPICDGAVEVVSPSREEQRSAADAGGPSADDHPVPQIGRAHV